MTDQDTDQDQNQASTVTPMPTDDAPAKRGPRWWLLVTLIALGVAIFWIVWGWHFVYLHLTQELGIDDASSRAYNFWSGIMGGVPTLAFLGGAIAIYRAHNCHVIGCYRVKRRITPQGNALCHVHSAQPLSRLKLPEVHQDHLA